jgi:hypothetical protein
MFLSSPMVKRLSINATALDSGFAVSDNCHRTTYRWSTSAAKTKSRLSFCLKTPGTPMMAITRETHWSCVPRFLGIVLVAAGAADGHDLVVSVRDVDWLLLIRADLELLGGFWLFSGRFPRGARMSAIITFVSILAYDLARMLAGYPARHVVGQIATSTWWVFLSDLLILAGLLRWRTGPAHAARIDSHPGRFAAASFIAAALGVAIDRSQVGQFPIMATVRAGRSTSGLDYLVYLPDGYYRSLERWPLILTLHGRGEAGDDIGLVRRQGLPLRVEEQGGVPFVIVAPQSSDWAWNV